MQDEEVLIDVAPDNQCANKRYTSVGDWANAQGKAGRVTVGVMVLFTSYVTAANPEKERWVAAKPGSGSRDGPLW